MRSPGTYISAVGHTGLLVWLIAGWGLSAEPLPFEVTEVDVISGEDFAQLVAARTPEPDVTEPEVPVVPIVDEPPAAPDPTPEPVEAEPPEPVEPAPEEAPPPDAPEPEPEPTVVDDTPPDVAPPAPEETQEIPEPITEDPPQETPATRVAPDPVETPEPDADIAEVPSPPVAPDVSDAPPEPTPEEPDASADTATEIVTEADTPSGAVATSLRPTARPNRPTPQPAAEPDEEPEVAASEDPDVTAALEAALSSDAPDVPQGPPMSGSERDAFRVAVNRCWNVDPGSVAARVTMTVAFSLTQEGRVDGGVRQVSASGGDDGAVRTAFEAARRAILRCQGQGGYDLPADKYGQWQEVEITFDPSGMRLR